MSNQEETDLKKIAEAKALENKKRLEEKAVLSPKEQSFLDFYTPLSSQEKQLVQAWNDQVLEQAFTIEDTDFYETDKSMQDRYQTLAAQLPKEQVQRIEDQMMDRVGTPNNWQNKENSIYDVHSYIGHSPESHFSPQAELELPGQNKKVAEAIAMQQTSSVENDKKEVIDLYSKFLQGQSLTYDERSKIVHYDQQNNSFEQMQYRLEAIDVAQEENPAIDLSVQEEALCETRGEQEKMAMLISAEYYRQSTSEKSAEKKAEKKEEKQEKKVEKQAKKEVKKLVKQNQMII